MWTHSMRGLADDGALIYFEDQRSHPSSDMLGHVVVVETDTDEVLVKRLLRGSRPGVYDLESIALKPKADKSVSGLLPGCELECKLVGFPPKLECRVVCG